MSDQLQDLRELEAHALKCLRQIYGYDSFRPQQVEIVTAMVQGRDIVIQMATGAGKSLLYQLPALMLPGVTIVVSPLLSLIRDQRLELEHHNAHLATLVEEFTSENCQRRDSIKTRLLSMTSERSNNDMKILYMTPESYMSHQDLLLELARRKLLTRVHIDEVAGVFKYEEDYRPQCREITRIPGVPVSLTTADCLQEFMGLILKQLDMQPTTRDHASSSGTILFSSLAARTNLQYKTEPFVDFHHCVSWIAKYVRDHHLEHSGIIYCEMKKEAAHVAVELNKLSNGRIRTEVYHKEMNEEDKEYVQMKWKKGDVKIMCATKSFEMGIHNPNVRFVIHVQMPNSLARYYQATSRAGRDGRLAECILFLPRLHHINSTRNHIADNDAFAEYYRRDWLEMVKFALNTEECKLKTIERAMRGAESAELMAPCGHCTNCTRSPQSVSYIDATVSAWQVVQMAQIVSKNGANGPTLCQWSNFLHNVSRDRWGSHLTGVKRSELFGQVGGKMVEKQHIDSLLASLVATGEMVLRRVRNSYGTHACAEVAASSRLRDVSAEDIEAGRVLPHKLCMVAAPRPERKRKRSAASEDIYVKKSRRASADEPVIIQVLE